MRTLFSAVYPKMRSSHPYLLILFSLLSIGLLEGRGPKTLAQRFFFKPEIEDARVSPGNQYLSYISYSGSRSLKNYEFETEKRRSIRPEENSDIYDYYWISQNQLLVFSQKLGIPTEIFTTTDRLSRITPTEYVEVYDLLPDTQNKLIIKDTERSEKFFSLQLHNLQSGSIKTVAKNPGHIISWYTDKDGVVRIRLWVDENEDDRFEYRPDAESPWKEIHPGADSFGILFLDEPEKIIAFVRPKGETHVIGRYFDCAQNVEYATPIRDPEYDIIPDQYMVDPETESTFGFSYQAEKRVSVWLSDHHQALQARIDSIHPDTINEVHGFTMNNSRAIVRRSSDQNPGEWTQFNIESEHETLIGKERPWINPEESASTESIVFPNREEIPIHALVTRPPQKVEEKKLLVMVHGGPRARDYWGWDSEAQYFAALGYTVLKVNYRGSSEYGLDYSPNEHLKAIKASIVDVADGVRWALDQGYASKDKVAIYGSSFGGHVALRCAAEYPDLFACVIGYAGVYDWVKEMDREFKDEPIYWKLKLHTYYGDYDNEKALWREASAITIVDQINAPVYLIHGGADQIVASKQSRLMRTALKKAKKDVTLKILSFNNHGMVSEKPAIRFYQNLAKFIDESM
jgi:dipeptidyl aminopeptidase/acylaminoacyl peptidase